MPFCVLRSSLDRLKSNFSFVHNLGDKPWRALGDVRYFRWKCPLDEDEYHLFPLFLAYILRLRCPPWKTWNWWNLLIAHIGHMDNRESIQTNRKCFERENRYWPYQRSSTYSAILFLPVESTEKGLRVFHDPNQNFRYPFLKTDTPALYPKRPAARNWTHLIKLCLPLCSLFDVKRFVTPWLLSLIPTPTDTSDDY